MRSVTELTFDEWEAGLRWLTAQTFEMGRLNESMAKMVAKISKSRSHVTVHSLPVEVRRRLADGRNGSYHTTAVKALRAAQAELVKTQAACRLMHDMAERMEEHGREKGWLDRVSGSDEYYIT